MKKNYTITIKAHLAEITISGHWSLKTAMPDNGPLTNGLKQSIRRIRLKTQHLQHWDTSLVLFIKQINDYAKKNNIIIDNACLPEGIHRILKLADSIPERKGVRDKKIDASWLSNLGDKTIAVAKEWVNFIAFIGDVFIAILKTLSMKARYRNQDLLLFIQRSGADALPIVSLISLLVGLILAFIGAIQLRLFGAELYVADLVAIGMTREMGAMMAAIIMAGRTGSAFAAQLGSMQVNEEIDAYKTFGISPIEFLVLPRVLALTLMMPLLVIYADVLGMLGGLLVSVNMFDISLLQYYAETKSILSITDISIGVVKGVVFGLLVSLAGCFQGINCGRSSAAVGDATTAAVVMSIVSIVVADSMITIITVILDI